MNFHLRFLLQALSEGALSEESPLPSFFDILPMGIVHLDTRNGQILFANLYFCQMTEYSKDEILQKNFFDLVIPEKFESESESERERKEALRKVQKNIERTKRHKNSFSERNFCKYLKKKDGGQLWGEVKEILFSRDSKNFQEKFQENSPERDESPEGIPFENPIWFLFISDCTHKKEKDKALWRMEEWLNLSQEVGAVGTFDWDIAQDRSENSPMARKILGDPPNTLWSTGPQWLEKIHPEDREKAAQKLGDYLNGLDKNSDKDLQEFSHEFRLLHSNGETKWVSFRGKIIRDQKGRAVRLLGTIKDFTEYKKNLEIMAQARQEAEQRAEEALERKRILDAMLEQVPLGIFITEGPDLIIKAMSNWVHERLGEQLQSYFGIPLNQIVGKRIFFHADGVTPIQLEELPLARAFRLGEIIRGEEVLVGGADGKKLPVLCTAAPIRNSQSHIMGGVLVWQDISEQKRAGEAIRYLNSQLQHKVAELETLFEILPVGVWVGDKDCKQIKGNKLAYEMLQLKWGTQLLLADHSANSSNLDFQVYRQDQLVPFEEIFTKCIENKKNNFSNVEYDFVFADGNRKSFYCNVAPMINKKEEIQGVVAVASDITERKKMEEALKDADRKKDEFLALLAHELLNPLASMVSARELLKGPKISSKEINFANEVLDGQLIKLKHLIEDLLDVSRITLGKLQLKKEKVDICHLLHKAWQSTRFLFNTSLYHLKSSFPPSDQTLWVEGDPIRLEQVFLNLITNAFRYTPVGGEIDLKVIREDEQVVIVLKDTGIGIPPEMQSKIFEPFIQGKRINPGAQGGLGIGLTLVKKILILHKGKVTVKSQGEGLGSEFIVYLPLSPDQKDQ